MSVTSIILICIGWLLLIGAPCALFFGIFGLGKIGFVKGVVNAFLMEFIGIVVLVTQNEDPSKQTIQYYLWGCAAIGILTAIGWIISLFPSHKQQAKKGETTKSKALNATQVAPNAIPNQPEAFDPNKSGLKFHANSLDMEGAAKVQDEEEAESIWDKSRHIVLPRSRLLVRYTDNNQATTDRAIEVVRAYGAEGVSGIQIEKVFAYCHLRKQMRTFRLDRIIYAADGNTGEVIADLPPWLIERKI